MDGSAGDASVDGGPRDAGDSSVACEPAPDGGRPVEGAKATLLATLKLPTGVAMLQLGPTALLGKHRVWIVPRAQPKDVATPAYYAAAGLNTAVQPWLALDGGSPQPWSLDWRVGDAGLPSVLLEPKALGLVPTSLIKTSEAGQPDVGKLFVQQAPYGLVSAVGIATITDGKTTALRGPDLFKGEVHKFASGAHRTKDGYVKLYACERNAAPPPMMDCFIARVLLAQMAEPSAYQAYVGEEAWQSEDLRNATPVLFDVGGTLSVDWNEYLGKFVALYGVPHEKDGPLQVALRVAATSEGEWSAPTVVDLPETGRPPLVGSYLNYAVAHADLAQHCGQRIVISYLEPIELGADKISVVRGSTHLVAIDLQ